MGIFVQRLGDVATCGHIVISTSNVLVNSLPCGRVLLDTAGGLIIGPGNFTVLVNNFPISLDRDSISSHGDSPHRSAKTGLGSINVLVGASIL